MTTTLKFPLRIPFVEQLGFELHGFGDGQAEVRVDLAATHLNAWEVAHGGVLMTLLDVAMANAARSMRMSLPGRPKGEFRSAQHEGAPVSEPGGDPGIVTVEMKTSFMRPGVGCLRAIGRLLHGTATMSFCEGSVFDADDRLCAHATGTFKHLRQLPHKARSATAATKNLPPETQP